MSHFAKRHYEAIARVMQEAQTHVRNSPTEQNKCVINLLAVMFKQDNGMFDYDRFIRACQLGANVRARS